MSGDAFMHFTGVIPGHTEDEIKKILDSDKNFCEQVSKLLTNLEEKNCVIAGEENRRKKLSYAVCINLKKNEKQEIYFAKINKEFKWIDAHSKIFYNSRFKERHYYILEDCNNNIEEVNKLVGEISRKNITNARFLFTLQTIDRQNNSFLSGCYLSDLNPKPLTIEMPTFFQELCDEYESHKKARKILIVGDVMLDHKMEGKKPDIDEVHTHGLDNVYKLSNKKYESKTLGGAANIAYALSKVSQVTLIGIIGSDCEGETLEKLCKDENIDFLPIKIPEVLTTTKIYFFNLPDGEKKEIIRFDREDRDLMIKSCNKETVQDKIFEKIKEVTKSHIDCIVLKDHEKGMISEDLLKKISIIARNKEIANDNEIPLFVDPKYKWEKFKDIKIKAILPNIKEASFGLYDDPKKEDFDEIRRNIKNRKLKDEDYRKLIKKYPECDNFVIKAEEKGAFILSKSASERKIEEVKSLRIDDIVTDVGCGDVFDAFVIIGMLNKHSLKESVFFANFVAGLRTKKPLGEVMSPDEINEEINEELKTESPSVKTYFEYNKTLIKIIEKDFNIGK